MRRANLIEMMQGNGYAFRVHICDIPEFREFIPDVFDVAAYIVDFLLEVIDVKGLLISLIIRDEGLGRNASRLFNLACLRELFRIRHEILEVSIRALQGLCPFLEDAATIIIGISIDKAARSLAHRRQGKVTGSRSKFFAGRLQILNSRIHAAIVARLICLFNIFR